MLAQGILTLAIGSSITACSPAIRTARSVSPEMQSPATAAVSRTLIISYDATTAQDGQAILDQAAQHKATLVYRLRQLRMLVIRLPEKADIQSEIQDLQALPGVLSVIRDRVEPLQQGS